MMMDRLLHTPEGVRDLYGEECETKILLKKKIQDVFHLYGYTAIETPTFEFFDVFSNEVGTTSSRELYKFFDREGDTLCLRPDFTPSIARAASTYYLEEQLPVRLCYEGSSFVNTNSYQGRLSESTQLGVELINDGSARADAEIIALNIESLLAAGLSEFQISIGHVGYFKSLVKEAGMNDESVAELRELISQKNYFGAESLLQGLKLPPYLENPLKELTRLYGNVEVLDRANKLTGNQGALDAIIRLREIYQRLCVYGYEKYVFFDLGIVSKLRYYTGILFQGYTYGTGEPIVKGGRYDKLLGYFGKDAAAIGFCVSLDALMNALNRQKISILPPASRTLLLYPDYLEAKAIRMADSHRKAGIDISMCCFDRALTLADYKAYGKRNRFGGILYLQQENVTYAINLATDEAQELQGV